MWRYQIVFAAHTKSSLRLEISSTAVIFLVILYRHRSFCSSCPRPGQRFSLPCCYLQITTTCVALLHVLSHWADVWIQSGNNRWLSWSITIHPHYVQHLTKVLMNRNSNNGLTNLKIPCECSYHLPSIWIDANNEFRHLFNVISGTMTFLVWNYCHIKRGSLYFALYFKGDNL